MSSRSGETNPETMGTYGEHPRLINTEEAALLLGTSVRSIQTHVCRGNLVPDKYDGEPFRGNHFDPERLLEWARTYKRQRRIRKKRAARG